MNDQTVVQFTLDSEIKPLEFTILDIKNGVIFSDQYFIDMLIELIERDGFFQWTDPTDGVTLRAEVVDFQTKILH